MCLTLPGTIDQGMAVDNIEIPEIGFSDSADNTLAQQWIVQAVTGGTSSKLPHSQRLIMSDGSGSSGTWRFALDEGELLLIMVSGANDDTQQRAAFDLRLVP